MTSLALLSGAAGLVAEVLWARRLALLLGGTALAQAAVMAAFLAGLAGGAAALGPRADRTPRPLALFARLELLVALVSLAAPLLLAAPAGVAAWLALGALSVQAFVMGGALPALRRAFGGSAQRAVGRLYAANSGGAAAGALLAAFAVVPACGLDWGFACAAALNLAAAAGALARGEGPAEPTARAAAEPEVPPEPGLARAAVFLSGYVALSAEVAWTRLLALVLGSSVYSFAEMLAAFIGGSALGARLASTPAARRRDPVRLLAVCLCGAGLSTLLPLPLFDQLPVLFVALRSAFGDGPWSFYGFEAAKFALAFLLMAAPAAFLGAAIPVAARLAERDAARGGAALGGTLAANAAGNVAGAAAGLLLLPALGVEGLLRSGAAALVLAGAGLAALARGWPAPRLAAGLALAAAALAAHRAVTPRWDMSMLAVGGFRTHYNRPMSLAEQRRRFDVRAAAVYSRDDREATVTVVRRADGILALKVNGKTDASTGDDMRTQILLGHMPLLLRPGARSAMLVGWGSGVTAGSMLAHPLERLDAVELIPAVVDASRLFDAENGAPRSDPRLALRVEDARTFLARPGPLYDVIVSEPSNPWMAGVGDLFSAEFYRRARARLAPGGLMAQWFHPYEMDDEHFRMVLRTFRSSFPHVTLWNVLDLDVVLIGSTEPIAPSAAAMDAAFAVPAVRRDLARAGPLFLSTLLAAQTAGEATVAAMAGDGPLNRETRPRLEYGAPKAFFSGTTSSVAAENDDRMDEARAAALLLARYARERRKPLAPDEYLDIFAYPRRPRERPLLRRWLAEWERLHPRDGGYRRVRAILDEHRAL